jgi:hypothetical protein
VLGSSTVRLVQAQGERRARMEVPDLDGIDPMPGRHFALR